VAGNARYTAVLDACVLVPSAITTFQFVHTHWVRPDATAEQCAEALERSGLRATARRIREAAEFI
jgi:hypothetical protein